MGSAPSEAADGSGAESSRYDGLSALAATVLGQLAVSSWLPAGFLVLALVALVAFRMEGSLDVANALEAIRGYENQVMFLIWAIPVLVVGTMLTQAFTFESIRVLEGYWWHRGPVGALRRWMTRRQLARKRRIKDARLSLSARISVGSRAKWVAAGTRLEIAEGLERLAIGASIDDLPEDLRAEVLRRQWWNHCDPSDVALVEDLLRAEREFPQRDARTMPTRLGNILRAAEDGLRNADGDVEGFALRRRSRVPARVQHQHDQFRARLDMYCALVFVAVFLAVAYPLVLLAVPAVPQLAELAGVTGAFLVLAVVSYQASIAAARGYVVVLRQMDEAG